MPGTMEDGLEPAAEAGIMVGAVPASPEGGIWGFSVAGREVGVYSVVWFAVAGAAESSARGDILYKKENGRAGPSGGAYILLGWRLILQHWQRVQLPDPSMYVPICRSQSHS